MKLNKKVCVIAMLFSMSSQIVSAASVLDTHTVINLSPSEIISTYQPVSKLSVLDTTTASAGIDWDHTADITETVISSEYHKRVSCTTIATNLDNPSNKVYHYSRARLEHRLTGKIYGDSDRKWGYSKTTATSGYGLSSAYIANSYYGN